MILQEFSDYLKNETEKAEKTSVFLLFLWLKTKLENPALSNIDKIIQKEIYIAKNKIGQTMFIAKSESGRTLINALYNFALSFEQHKLAQFLHDKNANNFNNVNKS